MKASLRKLLATGLTFVLAFSLLPASALAYAESPESSAESGEEPQLQDESDKENLMFKVAASSQSFAPFAMSGSSIKQIAAGYYHSAALKTDGTLWMWGLNNYGQLGDGTTVDRHSPVKVMDGVATVSLGGYHSAALKTDGSLWMWGDNSYGKLGDGTFTSRYSPIKVMDNVASVALGLSHSAVLKTDGTLWTWGKRAAGQLGDGEGGFRSNPKQIMDDVASIFAHSDCTAALKSDSTFWLCGVDCAGPVNEYSRLPVYGTPKKMMDDVASVAFGFDNSAALKSDGTLWMRGWNESGELGDGTTVPQYYNPIMVMDNVASVSLGDSHSAALKSDGTLWVWGGNYCGQLGDGTTTSHHSPTKIMDNAVAVSLGKSCSAVIKSDGSLWMWGDNYYGQLGDGTTTDRHSPVQITVGADTPSEPEPPSPLDYFDISNGEVSLYHGGSGQNTYVYTGSPITPPIVVRMPLEDSDSYKILTKDVDYRVEYFDNTEVGQARIEITGIGDYHGTKVDRFDIVKAPSSEDRVFTVGKDNYKFANNDEESKNGGFLNQDRYFVDIEDYMLLRKHASNPMSMAQIAVRTTGILDWDGSCEGMSTTMALAYNRNVSLNQLMKSNEASYQALYDLPYPYEHAGLLSSINFYHLLQYTTIGDESCIAGTINPNASLLDKATLNKISYGSITDFLDKLSNLITKNDKAYILRYGKRNSKGQLELHTVLLTGEYTQSPDGLICYVYDPNSAKDCSNNDGSYGHSDSKFMLVGNGNNYTGFEYHGWSADIDKDNYVFFELGDPDAYADVANRTASLREPADVTASEGQALDTATISIPLNQSVTVENSNGETLRYEDGNFSGDMPVVGYKFFAETGCSSINLDVPACENLSVSGSFENAISVMSGGNYQLLRGSGIESARFSASGSICVSGEGSFDSASMVSNPESDEVTLIEISGDFSSESSITASNGCVLLSSDTPLDNVSATSYVGLEERDILNGASGSKFISEPTLASESYTVTYSDGADGSVFSNQVYAGLESGDATPSFTGSLERDGYEFAGWSPAISATVINDIEYVAQWTKASDQTVTLSEESKTVSVADDPFRLVATAASDDAADASVQWSSSDPNVATVDQNGNVTISGVGTAIVTARVGDSSATCTVTAKPLIVNTTDESALIGSVEVISAELAQRVKSYKLEILKNDLTADDRFNNLFSDFNGVHVGQYDIHFIDGNDDAVQWSGDDALTVKIALSNDDIKSIGKYEKLYVHHIDEGMTTKTDMNAAIEGTDLVISTTHFSNYAITAIRSDGKNIGAGPIGPPAPTKVMYRLYNPNSGEHFYTAEAGERDSLAGAGWDYEGEAWKASAKSNTPVYRLYSGTDHHYTSSVEERDSLVRAGWKLEGIGWYSDDAKGVPLYRQYNPNVDPSAPANNSGSHNYTASKDENDQLVRAGWKEEGIGWYGCK